MAKLKGVIVDIETAGQEFDSFDEITKDLFLKYADTPDKQEEVKQSLSFYPLTAQVVAIGMIETDSEKGFILYQDLSNNRNVLKENQVEFIPFLNEKELLVAFWDRFKQYQQLITFNGRVFDCPFLMIRSAINSIKSAKNLMPNRYSSDMHIDLLDRLTFFGSVRKRFNLHMWCKAFGIESPKEGEVSGYQVKDLFLHGEYLKIAQYCHKDIVATKKLFQYWSEYLNFRT